MTSPHIPPAMIDYLDQIDRDIAVFGAKPTSVVVVDRLIESYRGVHRAWYSTVAVLIEKLKNVGEEIAEGRRRSANAAEDRADADLGRLERDFEDILSQILAAKSKLDSNCEAVVATLRAHRFRCEQSR